MANLPPAGQAAGDALGHGVVAARVHLPDVDSHGIGPVAGWLTRGESVEKTIHENVQVVVEEAASGVPLSPWAS